MQRKLPDLPDLARIHLENPGMPAAVKQWSLLALAEHGSLQDLVTTEQFLADPEVFYRRPAPDDRDTIIFECRVQDAAMLASCKLRSRPC